MQTISATHYDVLGIAPEATLAEIRVAYRDRLDAFRGAIDSVEPPDGELLGRLREAFTTLGNPRAREAYDAMLRPAARVAQAAGDSPPPPVAGAADSGAALAERQEGFRFVGEGGEYFRIWIVNLLLSILTLGIYSAWAKVRREQYFHRNLLLDGSGFDYHGRPIAILKGRLIAFALLLAVSAAQHAGPVPYFLALGGMAFLTPWLAIRAFRFRAANTSYRGLHFSFDASYAQACKVFVGYGLLALLSLGILFPRFVRELRKFILDHTRFGSTPFNCELAVGTIYRIFLMPMLALLALVLLGALAGGKAMILAVGLGVLLLYLLTPPYLTASTANAVWSSTRLGPHRFESGLPVGGFIRLTLVNWLAIVVTLGLFFPWAQVRVARYRAAHLALAVGGSLDDFVAAASERVTATGDEAADMFALDVAL